jgi:V8-like Glu-specific endopeptidase
MYPPQFRRCKSNYELEFDYALLKLKRPIAYSKYLPIELACHQCLMEPYTLLEIFGFPANHKENYKPLDKFGKRYALRQYGLAKMNRIIKIDPSKFEIRYALSTLGGQSGTCVCADGRIVGIHISGGRALEQCNIGRLLTPDSLENIQKWIHMLDGKPITIL